MTCWQASSLMQEGQQWKGERDGFTEKAWLLVCSQAHAELLLRLAAEPMILSQVILYANGVIINIYLHL